MEIIKPGTEDIRRMAGLTCCWPPGSEDMQSPAE